ncbi:MAG: hypothetical protein VYD19_11340 [Myxococcota bacterium]|nr:hypothetical protein [Myxococcota bacterium]
MRSEQGDASGRLDDNEKQRVCTQEVKRCLRLGDPRAALEYLEGLSWEPDLPPLWFQTLALRPLARLGEWYRCATISASLLEDGHQGYEVFRFLSEALLELKQPKDAKIVLLHAKALNLWGRRLERLFQRCGDALAEEDALPTRLDIVQDPLTEDALTINLNFEHNDDFGEESETKQITLTRTLGPTVGEAESASRSDKDRQALNTLPAGAVEQAARPPLRTIRTPPENLPVVETYQESRAGDSPLIETEVARQPIQSRGAAPKSERQQLPSQGADDTETPAAADAPPLDRSTSLGFEPDLFRLHFQDLSAFEGEDGDSRRSITQRWLRPPGPREKEGASQPRVAHSKESELWALPGVPETTDPARAPANKLQADAELDLNLQTQELSLSQLQKIMKGMGGTEEGKSASSAPIDRTQERDGVQAPDEAPERTVAPRREQKTLNLNDPHNFEIEEEAQTRSAERGELNTINLGGSALLEVEEDAQTRSKGRGELNTLNLDGSALLEVEDEESQPSPIRSALHTVNLGEAELFEVKEAAQNQSGTRENLTAPHSGRAPRLPVDPPALEKIDPPPPPEFPGESAQQSQPADRVNPRPHSREQVGISPQPEPVVPQRAAPNPALSRRATPPRSLKHSC